MTGSVGIVPKRNADDYCCQDRIVVEDKTGTRWTPDCPPAPACPPPSSAFSASPASQYSVNCQPPSPVFGLLSLMSLLSPQLQRF